MKHVNKGVISCVLAGIVVGIVVLFFVDYMKIRKQADKIDLFSRVVPSCQTIWYLSNTSLFQELLTNALADSILSGALSARWVSLLQHDPTQKSALLAVYEADTLLYQKAALAGFSLLKDGAFAGISPFKPRQEVLSGKITGNFYSLAGKEFFGYYEYEGVVVAGYSRRLLEKSAAWLISTERNAAFIPWERASRKLNPSVLATLLFPLVPTETSVSWLAADVYTDPSGICCFGAFPSGTKLADSLYQTVSVQIGNRIEVLVPGWKAEVSLEREQGLLYYSVCGKDSVSTTSLSYE